MTPSYPGGRGHGVWGQLLVSWREAPRGQRAGGGHTRPSAVPRVVVRDGKAMRDCFFVLAGRCVYGVIPVSLASHVSANEAEPSLCRRLLAPVRSGACRVSLLRASAGPHLSGAALLAGSALQRAWLPPCLQRVSWNGRRGLATSHGLRVFGVLACDALEGQV